MKTARENEMMTGILQNFPRLTSSLVSHSPEGEYNVDGRRCDNRMQSKFATVNLEIFAGNNLGYMRDRIMLRDSRVFNQRLRSKKNEIILHLICNDESCLAFRTATSGVWMPLRQKRLVEMANAITKKSNTFLLVYPTHPTADHFADIGEGIAELLGV